GSPRLPELADAWFLCGQVLARYGEPVEAVPYLSAFAERAPSNPTRVAADPIPHLPAFPPGADAQPPALRKKTKRRRTTIEAVARGWFLCGQELGRYGETVEAVPYLKAFVERAPFNPDTVAAYHILHLAAVARGDDAQALALRKESERRRRIFEVVRARTLQI